MRGDPPPTARYFRLLRRGYHWVDGVQFAALWRGKASFWWVESKRDPLDRGTHDISPNGWIHFNEDPEEQVRDLENPDLVEEISFAEMQAEIDPDPYKGLDCGEDLGL